MYQKQTKRVIPFLLSICCYGVFLLGGCTPKDQAVWTKIEEQIGDEDASEKGMQEETQELQVTVQEQSEHLTTETASQGATAPDVSKAVAEQVTVTDLYIHVCGAVNKPGVYELPPDSRLYEAIEKAGGFREDAQEDYLNLAALLSDGMKLQVPTREEVKQGLVPQQLDGLQQAGEGITGVAQAGDADAGLVNLNTADSDRLCTLPGVGKTRADSIITYRDQNGAFHQKEDIMKVEGIKEGLYDKIKEFITV